MKKNKIKVILADDHQIVLEGLVATLASESDIEVIGTALDGVEVLELLQNCTPDVLVLDISMPKLDGIETLRRISELSPEIKVIFLTMHNDPKRIFGSFEAKADGYILKNRSRSYLVGAIRKVYAGGTAWGPEVTQKFMETMAENRKRAGAKEPEITEMERRVLELLAEGMTSKEIADTLCRAPTTVETHKKNLMAKLNLKNSFLLVRYAVENGIVRRQDS